MSNTSNGLGEKGSKFWMQKIVREDAFKNQLEQMLEEKNLYWWSPLEQESYKEYQLKEIHIVSHVFCMSKDEFKEKFSFWPSNQPHWDAIATSNNGDILYLFEAKAHIGELYTKLSARSEKSIILIKKSLEKIYKKLSKTQNDLPEYWTKKYYQLANRMTFLDFMNEMAKSGNLGKIKKVILVLLNIMDDMKHIPTSENEWKEHYQEVFKQMIGTSELPPNVKILYFPGRRIK